MSAPSRASSSANVAPTAPSLAPNVGLPPSASAISLTSSLLMSECGGPPSIVSQPQEAQPRTASPSHDHNSLCHLRAAELFPKKELESEEPCLAVPFVPICGEAVQYLGRTQDGVLALSNYRVYHRGGQGAATIIPLMLVESADIRDIFYLHIMCKDARSLRCTFATGERCAEWLRRIETAIQPPTQLEELFAFPYHAWAAEPGGGEVVRRLSTQLNIDSHADFKREVSRLQFDLHGAWRVSSANSEFRLCPSYPPLLLVPACVSDDELETVAKFRSSRRIPAIVWRHRGNGAVIARCSQPEVGWLGWRSNEDEQLIASVWAACNFDRGPTASASTVTTSAPGARAGPKVLIVDARSYTSAVTNRARGGGCECPQYYPCAEIQFMCLPNIHSVRKSFQALRALAGEPPDHANWHSVLERSLWLQAIGGLLRAACLVARAVHVAARPTLVHCSDGWDRTPQIVATAQLLLDPYYRTCEGFRVLVEREWLDFGHKFSDRCGHTVGADNLNERCPVFLQWLDCVHQILVQYPCSFEFSQAYLIKLAQHAYSCLFGTFLCNSRRERTVQRVAERTFSVWQFVRGPAYLNHLYEPNKEEVLYPAHSARALVVWAAVYLGAAPDTPAPLQPPAPSATTSSHTPTLHSQQSYGGMTKTRSYGDLLSHSEPDFTNYGRRSSDPSISVDPLKLGTLSTPGAIDQQANNNSSDPHQQLIDEYSDDSVDSDSILGQPQPGTNAKCTTATNGQSNYIQMQNLLNTDSLINTMIPKQVLNGYSPKANGNIVPTHNGANVSSIDSNSNTKADEDYEADLINKLDSNGIYENGNTPMINEDRSLLDSPDQIDGPNTEYAEQAIETIPDDSPSSPADYLEERPARIVTGAVAFKSGGVTVLGLTPTEDTAVFLDGNFSESGDSVSVGRVRNESLTWRSISECSQQTDSSSGCVDLGAELNNSGGDGGNAVRTTRRQRFDSVQNGGLNDTAAILLETEIGNLISEESAANRLEQQQQNAAEKRSGLPPSGSFVPVHRRQRSDGGGHFEHFPPLPACSNMTEDLLTCSDMTLCPNSPLRACHRTQSAGASNGMGRWHGRSAPASCSAPADGLPDKPIDRLSFIVSNAQRDGDESWRGCACDLQHHHERLGWPHNSQHCRRVSDCVHRQCGNSSLAESAGGNLDPVDGLVCPQSPIQHRLHQIILDHKMREEKLMRDLHSARVELLQRACRTARLTPDHTDYYPPSETSSSVAGDGGGGGGAWVEGINRNGVLWVPDHAVSRCTRCATHFWLGKRKHHCRSCGRIFCAECSENTTPLPNEQLYSPVRVCAECFASLAPPLSAEERMSRMEQSTSVKSQSGARSRHSSLPANPNNHANPPEVRHLSEYCKQVTGDQKLTNSSQVTAASN